LAALESARLAVLGNQPGQLLPRVTADLHEVAINDPFVLAGASMAFT